MKNIVFIVDDYYPNYSAVGVCIKNIVNELYFDYAITIIAKKKNNNMKNTYNNNSYIRYINTPDNYVRNFLHRNIDSANGILRCILQAVMFIVRGYGYLGAIIKKNNIKKMDIEAIYKELTKFEGKIDFIIPTCIPFESIIAAVKYKNDISNETKVVPFLFDKFSANSTLHRTERNKSRKFKKHILLERQMFGECDKLIFVESWAKHLHEYYEEYDEKCLQVEHPLLMKVVSDKNIVFDSQRINIVYTGALYKNNRSPIYALKEFSKIIDEDKRITLHMYITGNCDSVVNSYCKKYPKNIINHGCVQTDTAKAAIISADILLSIGNSDITQFPSKIFEYISTGNPIIHFYSQKQDPVNHVLSRYSNSVCIPNEEKLVKHLNSIIIEVINNCKNKFDFAEVEKIYYNATPKLIANEIKKIL